MGFIFKLYQPLFCFPVNFNRHFNGTCIDFIADFHIIQLTCFPQIFTRDGSHIHQRHKFLIIMYIFSQLQIQLICLLYGILQTACINLYILKDRFKGCMTTVIRPVGIQYLQLCQCQITLFLFPEVFLNMLYIRQRHSQPLFTAQCLQTCFIQITEAT